MAIVDYINDTNSDGLGTYIGVADGTNTITVKGTYKLQNIAEAVNNSMIAYGNVVDYKNESNREPWIFANHKEKPARITCDYSTGSSITVASYGTLTWNGDYCVTQTSTWPTGTCPWEKRGNSWETTPLPQKTPQQKLHEIIESRMAPAIIRGKRTSDFSRFAIRPTSDLREMRARETLQRVIGEEKFRDFLRHGFITVRNRISGYVYQMFPGHEFTRVFKDGKMVEKLCVVLRGSFPPTDTLIVRYLMALNNEEQLWALANKHGVHGGGILVVPGGTVQQAIAPREMPRSMEQLAKIAA